MLHGSILHELFQQGMLKDDFSSSFMDDEIRKIIKENLQELYFVGENEEVTFEHLKKFVEYFGEFQQLYMTDRPQARTYDYFIVIIFTRFIIEHIITNKVIYIAVSFCSFLIHST
jgi:hypothetical protein